MGPVRRRVVLAVALMVVVAGAWWVRGADERRVDAACDTWLQHRESLRTAVSESEEAIGHSTNAHERCPLTSTTPTGPSRTSGAGWR